MGYIAPYNGEVVSVNVNSAFASSGDYLDVGFDFIIIGSGGAISTGQTDWNTLYTSSSYMSGFSKTFSGTTNFSAGDLILCYIGDYSSLFSIPIPPTDGGFNVTLYVKYTS